MDPIFSQQLNYAQPKPKGGMFGGDGKFGIGQAIVAALNGYLAGMPGPSQQVGANNLQMMAALRQKGMDRQQELADYARKRADDQADWRTQYDYELANPKQGQIGEFEQRLIASGVQPGTPEWVQANASAVQNVTDPVVMTPQGPMLRSQVMGALAPTPAPPGVTFTPIPGGPTPQASGGFLGASY